MTNSRVFHLNEALNADNPADREFHARQYAQLLYAAFEGVTDE